MKQFLKTLLERFDIGYQEQELNCVLTHSSFSPVNNHSRYVFLGQFAFRGEVARWAYEHVGGTGTQLQHYLGNMFRQSFLESFFDKYHFSSTRINPEINIASQKHIFVYAFLGLVYANATPEQLEMFIFKLFVTPNEHLLPQNHKSLTHWEQLVVICKQHFDQKPKLIIESHQGQPLLRVTLGNTPIGSHTSVSFKYAKKKAIALALKYVSSQIEERVSQMPVYVENQRKLAEKQEAEKLQRKTEKQEKHRQRIALHSEKMRIRREERKKLARLLDQKRRQTKQQEKERKTSRKGRNTIYREYTREEIAAMSNSKRRNLQDRGIIPKGTDWMK
ncbi:MULTISPECIES: hypothetical protein [Capnocytophaga]|uniref:hypothetical protein n=1 Tax=Capnocytophaga TaxID=1016 RepID=UPI000BB1DD97|nr:MULTISPECIES: hypothetical protein [Capnocytophaga]ATA72364.1 hypothetical protein CGC49_03020 [Capnocytophaga sp. H4358]GIM59574.1 hypothetical protein CAPN007_17830 [Capnocytophaga canimorsus]GIM60258.1 hypothetical protein CAPN008_03080 [Capnocytophaga canis]